MTVLYGQDIGYRVYVGEEQKVGISKWPEKAMAGHYREEAKLGLWHLVEPSLLDSILIFCYTIGDQW